MFERLRSKPKHVLVLGGGVGGLTAASALRRHLSKPDKITVVDRDGMHVQGLSLLWLLRGWREPSDVVVRPGAGALRGIELHQAAVEELSLDQRRVRTSNGALHYDALVIALGAQVDPAAMPGLPDALASGAAGEFYTAAGASQAHQRLTSLRGGRVALVVSSAPYKCPAAPWEAAFLTADLLRETGARGDVDLQIYTPEPQPMPVAGPVLGASVVEMLDAAGIGHQLATPVTGVDGSARQLDLGDGDRADFDYALFVPPHRAPKVVREAAFSEPGWIPVDSHSLATSTEGVWAVGDITSITLTNGKPLPKAAVFARGQAEAAASAVARYLGRSAPDTRFDGVGYCYLETGGHLAAKGAGNFYAEGGPEVQLHQPSRQTHEEKQAEEFAWLAQWNRSH
jgi:sulfide:quinone oxidoreductase